MTFDPPIQLLHRSNLGRLKVTLENDENECLEVFPRYEQGDGLDEVYSLMSGGVRVLGILKLFLRFPRWRL